MPKKKIELSQTEKIGIGVGLTAAAVAAAGAYFLHGSKDASKNKKAVKSWALKAKAEVLENLEDAKEITQEEYLDLINSVAAGYTTAKSASKKDIKEFQAEMKEHWVEIEKSAKPVKRAVKKAVKKAAKKAIVAKKVAKKTAKKAAKKVTKKPAKKAAKKTTKKKK